MQQANGRDDLMRYALQATAFFNVGGALVFAFPDSLGRLVGFPGGVPRVYSATIVIFVLLFAGAYAWLARQPRIDRPLVAMAAIGKASLVAAMVGFWLLGDVPARTVVAVSGDLVFVIVFCWWLLADGARAEGVV
ncbi:MAG: hypothetical protein ACREQ9_12395 [Candidatus Binatia bacterium]